MTGGHLPFGSPRRNRIAAVRVVHPLRDLMAHRGGIAISKFFDAIKIEPRICLLWGAKRAVEAQGTAIQRGWGGRQGHDYVVKEKDRKDRRTYTAQSGDNGGLQQVLEPTEGDDPQVPAEAGGKRYGIGGRRGERYRTQDRNRTQHGVVAVSRD